MLIGFGRAVAKATVFCEANPAACVRAFWALYPQQKPTNVDEAKALQDGIKIMRARSDKYLDFDDAKVRRWGEFSLKSWKDFAVALYEGGQLTTKDVPYRARIAIGGAHNWPYFDPMVRWAMPQIIDLLTS